MMLTDVSNDGCRVLTALGAAGDDRKTARPTQTPYPLVKVEHDRDEGLARCRDLSDGGAKLDLAIALTLNDRVTISFTPTMPIDGRVIWISGNGCGIAFDEPIDSELLQHGNRLANRRPAGVPSVPGQKVANDGNFHPGLNVRVILADGQEREGLVRWSQDNIAGVMLLDSDEACRVQQLSGPAQPH